MSDGAEVEGFLRNTEAGTYMTWILGQWAPALSTSTLEILLGCIAEIVFRHRHRSSANSSMILATAEHMIVLAGLCFFTSVLKMCKWKVIVSPPQGAC